MSNHRTLVSRASICLAAAALAATLTSCGDQASQSRPEAIDVAAVSPVAGESADRAVGQRVDLTPDKAGRADFPGDWANLDDGSSATSDGETLLVSTAAEEEFAVALPTSAEGWISDELVDLGDAGVGYLVTQSGGEYLQTSLAVLHEGDLFLAEADGDVPFGDGLTEDGTTFETWTTDNGAHLYTRVGADDVYSWTVRGTTLVPTSVKH